MLNTPVVVIPACSLFSDTHCTPIHEFHSRRIKQKKKKKKIYQKNWEEILNEEQVENSMKTERIVSRSSHRGMENVFGVEKFTSSSMHEIASTSVLQDTI